MKQVGTEDIRDAAASSQPRIATGLGFRVVPNQDGTVIPNIQPRSLAMRCIGHQDRAQIQGLSNRLNQIERDARHAIHQAGKLDGPGTRQGRASMSCPFLQSDRHRSGMADVPRRAPPEDVVQLPEPVDAESGDRSDWSGGDRSMLTV